MPKVERLSGHEFWRYQKDVFKRARRRWWKTKGKHWWAEATAASVSVLLRLPSGAGATWWGSVGVAIGGGACVAFLIFLVQLVAASVLIDQEKTDRIQRLSGRLTDEDVVRSQNQRVELYKRILRLASSWGDLATLVDDDPASRLAQRHLETLRTDVAEVSELVSFSDAWWGEKYAREIETVRRSLLVVTKPRAAVDCLGEPIRRLKEIAEEEKTWDLSRQPVEEEEREN